MEGRFFNLNSSWLLNATPTETWAIIADPEMSWPSWWPNCSFAGPLVRTTGHGTSPDAVLLATTTALNFKASLGYTLTITIHPTSVRAPAHISFEAGGDLNGTGGVRLSPAIGNQTQMNIEWRVRPTKRWMMFLAPVAGQVFAAAHAQMMRQGEQGLRSALETSQSQDSRS
ncbi:hypothetical protein IV500_16930 [Paeniglutamicibacter antarcticus]|uniref:Polyketide cyclase / dehydrase and lipid transport n=1 Tax=Arthrobacter terrae TaxID=2935737 RepID=A0A931G9D5_9MICC|nr:SRPBCC family protein [Arthrobacter terrae]MBG0741059.1 hypothetical protein [Arthrobacter terrae]